MSKRTKHKVTDMSWAVGRGYAAVSRFRSCLAGAVATPHGFVAAYSKNRFSSLQFIWKGQEYSREFEPGLTEPQLVRHAHAFAREIAGGGK